MLTIELYARSLRVASGVVDRVRPADLARSTPCAGWDLSALLAHCIGQHHGFADAVTRGSADVSAYAPRPPEPGAWAESVEQVRAAFRAADPARVVPLAELGGEFPVARAMGFHLLDTVVHTWDVATALGEPFRPDDELLAVVAAAAPHVPAGAAREVPGAAFGPVLTVIDDDPWTLTLARLGRDPTTRSVPDRPRRPG